MANLLGLDIGTTTIKAAVYDPSLGRVNRVAVRPTPVYHPQEDRSEHDPEALWQTALSCIKEAASGQPIAGMSISSMAEAGVLLDKRAKPVSPVIAWYDRRSEPQASQIERCVSLERLYQITGQRVSPSFGATKLLWLRENLPNIFQQGSHWLPLPAYVLYRLTGQMAVDYTIAARTLLFDQSGLNWSKDVLEALRLPESLLPPPKLSGTPLGIITSGAAKTAGLPAGTVCGLGGHDHLCAALAAGAHRSGALTDSTGSANALMLLLPQFLSQPVLARQGYACYAYLLENLYVLKGGMKAAGSALEWLARLSSDDRPDYIALESSAAAGIARRAGPLWLPHLIGSGTPQGDRLSRAALVGVQFEHTQGDLFRGMLESLACWLRHNVEAMQLHTGLDIDHIILTGGTTRLKLLSQLKADVLNRPVETPDIPEAAATGAALLAGLAAGVFNSVEDALSSLRYDRLQIDPNPRHVEWYNQLYNTVYEPLYRALQPSNLALERLQNSGDSS